MSTQAPPKPRPVQRAQAEGAKVARSRGFEWLARAGFVARGLIYGIIGVLAIKLAVGVGGTTVLLDIVAAGLIAFAVYSLSDARYRRI